MRIYIDGKAEKTRVLLDELNQTFKTKEPLRIGSGGGPASRFKGLIDDVRVYDACLTDADVAVLATAEPVDALAALPPEKRTAAQALKLRACYLEKGAAEPIRRAGRKVQALRRERERLVESFPTTMVMAEMDPPRTTHLLLRGAYDKPGDGGAARRPGVPEPAAGRRTQRPPAPGALAGGPGQPADRACGGQPHLADALRNRPGEDRG